MFKKKAIPMFLGTCILAIGLFVYANVGTTHELLLPKPSGPYAVGTKAIEIQDPTRKMFRDSSPRRWMVQAYYPAENHDGVYPYMLETIEDGVLNSTRVLAHSKPNAAPVPSLPFPVIIFVPGLGEERQKYTILCEELASQGYVVLSLDQPYVSNFVKFPDGTTIVLTLKDAWNVSRDRDYRYQYFDEAMTGAIQDVEYMLAHLDKFESELNNCILDKNNTVLMGHSFGGNVAHTLGVQYERVRAIVDIDSKITDRKIYGRIGVSENPTGKPILFIRGMLQYQEDVGDQLTNIANATIWSPHVQHSAFSDQAFFAAKIPGFGYGTFHEYYNWFFKQGPHWSSVDTNLGGKDMGSWFSEYRQHIVKWLGTHVPPQQ